MKLNYVLITPARNEEAFIEETIRSVVAQTILPTKWVIISDGSTDRTDEIVKKYARGRDWIEFIRMPEHRDRHFASKVHSFNAGYNIVKNLKYDIIGNLDADVSFEKDYFEYLLEEFEKDPGLGVAGTDYMEGGFHSFKDSYINVHHVNGQCQMFRRECFEDIGGYVPIRGGGIDWVAVTTARMKGWKTYSFQDKLFVHHRSMGTAGSSVLRARFHYGKKDYFLGGHPLWEVCRSTFQMIHKPYIIGGLSLMTGYLWGWLSRAKRPVSKELIRFHRQEQMRRLQELMTNGLKLKRN